MPNSLTKTVLRWGAMATGFMAVIAVGGWALGAMDFVGRVEESDPPPFPGKIQLAQTLTTIQKGQILINKRLDYVDRHNRDQDLKFNAMRRKAVLLDLLEIQTELRRNPSSVALKTALDQDNQDLGDLASEHQALLKGK